MNHNILGELHIECGLLRKWRQYQTAQLRCSIDQSVRVDWDLNTALLTNNILKGSTCYQTKDQKLQRNGKHLVFYSEMKLKHLGFGVEASRTKTQTNQEPGKSLSYFQIYFIHVLARLFDRPSLFKTFHLLRVSTSSLCLWSSPPAERPLPFTQCRMEEYMSDDAPSQVNSQSTDP